MQRTLELKEQFKELAPYQQERVVEFVRRHEIEQILRHGRLDSDKPLDHKAIQDKSLTDFNLQLKQAQQQLAKGNELSL